MILKFIFMLILVAGINEGFKDWKRRSRYKNTNPEMVKLDSLIMVNLDSTLTNLER